MNKFLLLSLVVSYTVASDHSLYYFYNNGKKIYFQKEKSQDAIKTENNNKEMNVKSDDPDVVKIKNTVLAKFASEQKAKEVLEGNYVYKKLFGTTYKIQTKTAEEALELANKLYECGDVIYAQPDLVKVYRVQ